MSEFIISGYLYENKEFFYYISNHLRVLQRVGSVSTMRPIAKYTVRHATVLSSVPDPSQFGTEPDPDPRIIRTPTKNVFYNFFRITF